MSLRHSAAYISTATATADPRQLELSFAEFEIPLAPRFAEISFSEIEVPLAPRRVDVSFIEIEVPLSPRFAEISFTEIEVPLAPRFVEFSFSELEIPLAPRRAEFSFTEIEIPSAPRRAEVSFIEIQIPTAPLAGLIAIISDLSLTGHPEDVRDAAILGADGLLTESNFEIRTGGFSADISYAASAGAIALIRSTTGLTGYIAAALSYYRSAGIQGFVPSGSNSPGEVFESNGGTNLPSIVVTGAGDVDNETADDVEFISPDPITLEPDLSSFSNGFIFGQLLRIKVERNCSWWEARYCARMTASEGGVWDEINGYGLIDVDAAIAYGGSIPDDPYAAADRVLHLSWAELQLPSAPSVNDRMLYLSWGELQVPEPFGAPKKIGYSGQETTFKSPSKKTFESGRTQTGG